MTTRFLIGTVFDQLATLPDTSVDLVATSPPFLALRSYLPADHPTKSKEIGSEPTPAHFLDTVLDVVEACDRVLAPHGSLCFEIGDTYSGRGGAGGDWIEGSGHRIYERGSEVPDFSAMHQRKGAGWPLDKSLTGVPTLFAWSLAYGRNLLRPERTTPPWRIRNVIAWGRPNPPVGALGDKCRPATSYITVATKSRTRYWDMDAVRVPSDYDRPNLSGNGSRGPGRTVPGAKRNMSDHTVNPAGAPLLDWWSVPTQPSNLAHFAMWPEEVARRLILLMCPEQVCVTCGEPRRRIVETTNAVGHAVQRTSHRKDPDGAGDGRRGVADVNRDAPDRAEHVTVGWTDCESGNYRRGVVLDPFGGSGTTGAVAAQLGRDAILIDLDERNAELARKRVSGSGLLEVVERDGQREAVGQGSLL